MKKSIIDRLESEEFVNKYRHEIETRLQIPQLESGAIFKYGIQDFSGNGKLSEAVEFSCFMPAALKVVAHLNGDDPQNVLSREYMMKNIQSSNYRLVNIKHKGWLLSEEIIAMRKRVNMGPGKDEDQKAIHEILSWFIADMPNFTNCERRDKFWHNEFYSEVQKCLIKAKEVTRGAAIMLKKKVTSDSISRAESECIRGLTILSMDGSYSPHVPGVSRHHIPTLKVFCAIRFAKFLASSIDGDICNPGWIQPAETWNSVFSNDFA